MKCQSATAGEKHHRRTYFEFSISPLAAISKQNLSFVYFFGEWFADTLNAVVGEPTTTEDSFGMEHGTKPNIRGQNSASLTKG